MNPPTPLRTLPPDVPTGLLIGGTWRDGGDEPLAVENPATETTLTHVATATAGDVTAALDAACAAQEDWARTPSATRAALLGRAFEAVTERAEDFATVMTLEMGKTLAEARTEVTYGASYLRWFAGEADRDFDRYAPSPAGALRVLTLRRPVGPCLLITPWNFPLAMATHKIAPALAAGCTMVLKPASLTPLTSLLLADVLTEAGLPPGVLNVVSSQRASTVSGTLMTDPRLRKVSFTGSTPVGQVLLRQAADRVLRTSMELGGNAPFLVFPDADLDAAVAGAVAAKMRNGGQACTAANRFLVHEDVAAEFTAAFGEAVGRLTVGDGTDPATDCGPLVDGRAVASVTGLIDDAVSRGARVVTGGDAPAGPGHYVRPTVLADVPADARVVREEIFGPVAPVQTFRTEEEAVAMANDTEDGLASYVFTGDHDRVLRLSESLEFGLLGANAGVISDASAPFGGVKMSGTGREGGPEGLEEYTSVRYVGYPDPWR
ncbi:NAD-dependent succinate-semialdehyde dehydrogenase [Corynebacterium bovis]|uniref:NAD-dependent succinate-semialdehyde dehydrogenase n=7 Tax=Corynebacterium bovis TaxID=36808 RepID=A0A3R8PGT4_9CORY|nr:NAD-dependent succinate-semialdehyde dehydrogenase [Corynebacterium bovis]RRO91920.1 NAD-dependent succinate-semialdehyde dehydrogenase [Corynebacterium bovis]RRQ01833.1 NAD-dependent succinate-semialdehyde dehydrogenase [Corynebacterium bovis]RRQ03697.1 NAD-dependent succinate-semialdehyde dehydrogenase [Corynebacterium bovis]RRQ05644.1 NAD-dependent succinate-semialdehyde dehydrogenase [Corynebacterium bovis]RRQ08050.1 NAD-dependent succinate-semialdehyde dehydrogenase [Corynebacterium bo